MSCTASANPLDETHRTRLAPDAFDGTGVGQDASDLIRIYLWADDQVDPAKFLVALYMRYARASRITVPMVCRFLDSLEGDSYLALQRSS